MCNKCLQAGFSPPVDTSLVLAHLVDLIHCAKKRHQWQEHGSHLAAGALMVWDTPWRYVQAGTACSGFPQVGAGLGSVRGVTFCQLVPLSCSVSPTARLIPREGLVEEPPAGCEMATEATQEFADIRGTDRVRRNW